MNLSLDLMAKGLIVVHKVKRFHVVTLICFYLNLLIVVARHNFKFVKHSIIFKR